MPDIYDKNNNPFRVGGYVKNKAGQEMSIHFRNADGVILATPLVPFSELVTEWECVPVEIDYDATPKHLWAIVADAQTR